MKRPYRPSFAGLAALVAWLGLLFGGSVHSVFAVNDDTPVAPTSTGSGAFTGLAQAPEANLFVGSSAMSIPIEVPPGRRGMTPNLALVYSSGAGASPYGYGWNLPIGRVQRSFKHGVPICDPANPELKEFVLALPSGNVECTLQADNSCRSHPEEAFLSAQYRPGDNSWVVTEKNGTVYEFGSNPVAREGSNTAVLFEPAGANHSCRFTAAWGLEKVKDPNGNLVTYEYSKFEGTIALPTTIRYGGSITGGLDAVSHVVLNWQQASTPTQMSSAFGFLGKTSRKLARIDVLHQRESGAVWGTIRSYVFTYNIDGAVGSTGVPHVLNSVGLLGPTGEPLEGVFGPVLTSLDYSRDLGTGSPSAGFGFGARLRRPMPGDLEHSDRFRWHEKSGDYRHTRRQLLDMNADGLVDLVEATPCHDESEPSVDWKVFLGDESGSFSSTWQSWRLPGSMRRELIRPDIHCAIKGVNEDFHDSTFWETFDITGDHIPDHVRITPVYIELEDWSLVTRWYVEVQRGNLEEFGFAEAVEPWLLTSVPASSPNWMHPYSTTREVAALGEGSASWFEFVDMNGDGLQDYVGAAPGTGAWTIWYNTGHSFREPVSFPAVYDSAIRHSVVSGSQSLTKLSLMDMNADGLPDQVVALNGAVLVYLNSGYGFEAAPVSWGGTRQCGDGLQVVDNSGFLLSDLRDLNGDGFVDQVNACGWDDSDGGRKWLWQLGHGAGFGSRNALWESPWRGMSRSKASYTSRDLLDLDGDGLVDFVDARSGLGIDVHRNAGGAWCASTNVDPEAVFNSSCSTDPADGYAANPIAAKPYLLEQVMNGIGGRTTMRYRPSSDGTHVDEVTSLPTMPFALWTLAEIERSDGIPTCSGPSCSTPPGEHAIVTRFAYDHGVFDPIWREFRGFGTTETIYADDSRTRTFFHQDVARKGKVDRSIRYGVPIGNDPEATVFSMERNFWACVDRQTQAAATCAADDDVWVRNRRTETYTYDPGNVNVYKKSESIHLAWDECGNIEHVHSRGSDVSAPVDVKTEFACNVGALPDDRPLSVRTEVGLLPIQKKWFFYDERGNATRVESWLDQWSPAADMPIPSPCTNEPTTSRCVSVQTTYDDFGNPTVVTNENGNSVTTTYDTLQIYPRVVTNALGHSVYTEYDSRCGTVVRQSVPYVAADPLWIGPFQPAARSSYDDFCRLEREWAPDETEDSAPGRLLCHVLGGSLGGTWAPSVVRVMDRVPLSGANPSATPCGAVPAGYAASWVVSDALGRVIQKQSEAVVRGGPKSVVVTATNAYDARGNLAETWVPFELASISPGSFAPMTGTLEKSVFTYDSLGRMVQTLDPAGEMTKTEYSVPWQTIKMDACASRDDSNCTGGRVEEVHNAFGQVTEKRVYNGSALAAKTQFTYDGLGRLTSSTQWDGTNWNPATTSTYTYDSLGRKLTHDDPDSGLWRYAYDHAGNLLIQDDPNGSSGTDPNDPTSPAQHLQFCYDALGRMTKKYIVAAADLEDLQSPNGRRIGCAESHPLAAVVEFTYDQSTVPGSVGALTKVVDSSGKTEILAFDVRGRSLQVKKTIMIGVYPESVTMGYEYDGAYLDRIVYPDLDAVAYSYDEVGNPEGMESVNPRVVYVENQTYDLFGRPVDTIRGSGVRDERTYHDASENFRLASIAVRAVGTSNAPSCGPATSFLDLQYTEFNARGQLSEVTDAHASCPQLNNSAEYAYDGLGRLISATGAFGGTYGYDALGNLTSKDGRIFAYNPNHRPHVLEKIDGSAAGVVHDDNGNRLGKSNATTYKYDPEGRLTEANNLVRYKYDYSGKRVLRIDNTDPMNPEGSRYFTPEVETRNMPDQYWGRLTKHYFFGGVRVASRDVGWSVAPVLYASAENVPPVTIVASARGWGYEVRLRPDVQQMVPTVAFVGFVALVFLPDRRRRKVVGIRLRRGPTLLVVGLWTMGTFPGPVFLVPTQPAWANGGGGSAPPKPAEVLRHFHYDHLGSLQVMTTSGGSASQYIRYKPFGEERGRFNAALQPVNPNNPLGLAKYTFTGYEQDGRTGLQYANARWYDPELGQFATHDPQRQFDSPYNYGAWDPTNLTDPSGEFITLFTWSAIILAAAAGLDAGIQTGDPIQGLKSFGINLGMTFMRAGMEIVTGPALSALTPSLQMAANMGLGTYGTVDSLRKGAYVSAAVTFGNMVYSAHGIATEAGQGGHAQGDSGGGRSGSAGYDIQQAAYDSGADPESVRAQIAQFANDNLGNVDYAKASRNGNFPEGSNKCNLFVRNAIESSGGLAPMNPGGKYPIIANSWADPKVRLSGWQVVSSPLPGDIAAFPRIGESGHVGIYVGGWGRTVIGAHTPGVSYSKSHFLVGIGLGWSARAAGPIVYRRWVGGGGASI